MSTMPDSEWWALVIVLALLSLGASAGARQEGPAGAAPREQVDETLAALSYALQEARAARMAGDHERARSIVVETIEHALEELAGSVDAQTLAVLESLAAFAHDTGELRAAERARRSVLEGRLRTLPSDHLEIQTARGNLANTLRWLGDLESARLLEETVLEVFSRTLPADHLHLQKARAQLAATRKALGDLQGARALEETMLEVISRTLPADHLEIQAARLNLGGTLHLLGDLRGARPLLEQALEVCLRTRPADDTYLQAARANLALTLKALGDLQGARALEEIVLDVRSRSLPADHPSIQAARANLARTIKALGDLQGARVLEETVLEGFSRTLAADHLDVQRARINLALTIKALGDLQGARALEETVLEGLSRSLPADNLLLQTARLNLASTLQTLGDWQGARVLTEAMLEVLSDTLPSDNPDLQTARGALAMTIRSLGEIEEARALFEQVLEVRSRILPADHLDLLWARAQLGSTLHMLGDLRGARAISEQVLELLSRALPDDHPELQVARRNLTSTIVWQAAFVDDAERGGEGVGTERERARARCAELARDLGLAQARAALLAIRTGSAREAEEQCSRSTEELGIVLSFALGYGFLEPNDALLGPAFVLSETARGAGLACARVARAARGSVEHAQLAAELREVSRELTALAQRGTSREEYHAARSVRERLERELGRVARELGGGDGGRPEDLVTALAERLGDGTALTGFRRSTRSWLELEEHGQEGEAARWRERSVESLGAFVLARGSGAEEPRLAFVDLGPSEPIERAVREWRTALGVDAGRSDVVDLSVAEARGVGLSGAPSASALASGRALRRLVWDPLHEALGGARRVILAPDDVLHLVPFDALPMEEESALVGDRWRIETRAALWELLDPAPATLAGGTLLALGGAAFDEQPAGLDENDEEVPRAVAARTGAASLLRGSAWSAGFAPLAHTAPEAIEIAALFAEQWAEEEAGLVLEQRRASRAALEAAAARARWLHVATHGWIAPESVRSWGDVESDGSGERLWRRASGEEVVRGMSPMLLCGLALAGANLPPDSLGRVSGLLTADELSTLDLGNCELAVLSACDTNVGERRAGQGVASLQKALHMAGARSVVTSLWKVPDEATRELMLDFYRRLWVEQKPKHQALWEAKKRLRETTDERGAPRYTTRDWAAWVLTGEPD